MLPKMPKHVFSHHGAVPVSYMPSKKAQKKGLLGLYDFCVRTIVLRPGMVRQSEWLTLWHEAGHVALFDSGVHQHLSKEQEEAVCDALGHYMTAAMQAGYITVHEPARKL